MQIPADIDPGALIQMIQSNVKSAIPWSRKHFDFQGQMQSMNNSMYKVKEMESRIRSIRYNDRLSSLQKEKQLNDSLKNNQERKNDYLDLKRKRMSLHSKKVDQKLTNYHNTQKSQFKKASISQKKFSQTINQYWKNKTKQSQKLQKNIYKRYHTQKPEEIENKERAVSTSQFLTQIKDESQDQVKTRKKTRRPSLQFQNKSAHIYSRRKEINRRDEQDSFQKLMNKLTKIQCKRKVRTSKLYNTQQNQSQSSVNYISSSPAPKRLLGTRIIRQQPYPHPTCLIYQRKKIPSKIHQNIKMRKTLHQQMYNSHTKYLQNYKNRIKYLDNIKQVKQKLIESKLYVQRKQTRSNSII